MTTETFYNQLAPCYHLNYADWNASMERQAALLHGIIQEVWGSKVSSVLDAACGIGTQALGLAALGYRMAASDLSGEAVERARQEAAARSLDIDFEVADMRCVSAAHGERRFDLVIACDNAVPHLLSDADLLRAFEQFHACLHPGGGCLLTVRDYQREEKSGVHVKPIELRRDAAGVRHFVWQVWEFDGPTYDLSLYLAEDGGQDACVTRVLRSRCYAVGTDTLMRLMRQAGFEDVTRLDDRFYQPVLVGSKRSRERRRLVPKAEA